MFTLLSGGFAEAADPTADDLKFFQEQIQPIFAAHCDKCHGAGKAKGGLTLASRMSILNGGETGPAVDLAKPAESLLLQAVRYEGLEMPPSGKLPADQIALLTKWVERGLPMPAGAAVPPPKAHAVPQVNEETKNHWSFRPLRRPDVPSVKQADWVANPIDAFVLAKLEADGLRPNPPAPARALVRRVHYDLLGLPPSPALVERFATAPSVAAYRSLTDEWLGSVHHGEHYARYWLDLVRYAESNSFERDNPKPFVWRYRDYVIRAFAENKPYDRFLREQIAGDELDEVTPDSIIATGYYRLGLWDDEPADPELAFYDGLDDYITTTSQAFLGLTLNCARCHDHKIDPLPQADYYRFAAIFRNVKHFGQRSDESVYQNSVRSIATPEEEAAFAAEKTAWESTVAQLRSELDAVEDQARPHLKGGEIDDFKMDSQRLRVLRQHVGDLLTREAFDDYAAKRKRWNDTRNRPPRSATQALCVKEQGTDVAPTHILVRGNPQAKGAVVIPGYPSVLSPPEPQIAARADGQSSGRRRALADWLVDRRNPLTARVMVNRLWQWHFGRGLVASTNNFGLQGDAPTHPELLDWLAVEFIESGWDLRHMHRLMLDSSTYRMASTGNPQALEKDPLNHLLWRYDMRRLRAEEIRDSLLAVNQSLNLDKQFGPSIYPTIEAEVLAGQSRPGAGWEQSTPEDKRRRSIYIHVKRSLTVPLLANFDVADADNTCPVRFATTQPTQALTMLNSVFLNEQAQTLAKSLPTNLDRTGQVSLILERTTQRPPTKAEIERGVALLNAFEQQDRLSSTLALKYFCLAALNLNEFLYLD